MLYECMNVDVRIDNACALLNLIRSEVDKGGVVNEESSTEIIDEYPSTGGEKVTM